MTGGDVLGAGELVIAHGLVGKADVNGLVGKCMAGGASRGAKGDRVGIKFFGGFKSGLFLPANLRPAQEVLSSPPVGGSVGKVVLFRSETGWKQGMVLVEEEGGRALLDVGEEDGEGSAAEVSVSVAALLELPERQQHNVLGGVK
eukprot:Hpha_TRINITY_DN35977_c0_g1::TRINITY_DN35977_c0_g1_i1::g.184914::m.184914